MRRPLAIAALSTALLAAPLLAQMHGGSRGSGSMGHSGFSSRGSVGFHGGSSFVSARPLGSGFRSFGQSSFRSGGSFGGFRQPFFGPRRFQRPFFGPGRFRSSVFFSGGSPFFFGYYGYPYYDSGYAYAPASYYPGYDYYASANATQNQIARQQDDIDRLEDEVARLREQRESRVPQPQAEEQIRALHAYALGLPRQAHPGSAATMPWWVARSGFSTSRKPPSFRFPGWTSRPPPRPTTIAGLISRYRDRSHQSHRFRILCALCGLSLRTLR